MSALDSAFGISYVVRESPFSPAGKVFLFQRGTLSRDFATLLVRHWSEYALLAAGATWHVQRDRCPTWDDATECRCMLGGEA